MTTPRSAAGLRRVVIVAALLAAAAAPVPVAAQGRTTDPKAAFQRRQIRGLEQRSVTQPVGPELQRQRRDLIRDNRGVDFDRQSRILERQLSRIPPEPRAPLPAARDPRPPHAPALRSTLAPDVEGLPDSYTPPEGEVPSVGRSRGTAPGGGSDVVTTASRLAARAEASLARGEVDRARSDVATADRLLGGVDEVPTEHAAFPRLATARERLNVLRDRIPAAASAPADRPE